MNQQDIPSDMEDVGELQVHAVGNFFEAINSEEVCEIKFQLDLSLLTENDFVDDISKPVRRSEFGHHRDTNSTIQDL